MLVNDRLVTSVLLATIVASSAAASENLWFAGAGIEFPRPGSGAGFGRLHEDGGSVVLGLEHGFVATTGAMVRLTYSSFTPDHAAASTLGYSEIGNASLATLVGGLRFRRRDLAFSPYFDVGLGLGLIGVRRIGGPPNNLPSHEGVTVGPVWSWGTGVAWRPWERHGLFLDGHWDTVPGGIDRDYVWIAALRAGVERR